LKKQNVMNRQRLHIPNADLKTVTLVVGGCKSGKSRIALTMADQISADKIFIATCVPTDDEMRERVTRHQAERSSAWQTVECPIYLPEAVLQHSRPHRVLLIDCLTLWLTNLYLDSETQEALMEQVQQLVQALAQSQGPVFLVTNEVGTGIVPENKMARQFRDLAGMMNQAVAACAQQVIWSVVGLPVVIKSEQV
jgi:adenosylcobinamide kinase/adenosylcobinamide-phosphate guanylyltransferase